MWRSPGGRFRPGIALPGLMCCGSVIQRGEVGGPVRDRQRGERARVRDVGQVGADGARARGAADRDGSWRTRCRRRPPCPGGRRRGGPTRRLRLGGQPGRERRPRLRRRPGSPCSRAAGRRTRRTARGRRPGWSASSTIRLCCPGIMSILRLSWGTQKEWMTSAVRATRLTRVADGDVDLVRRHRRRARIADLPEPLVADDVDRHAACCRRPAPRCPWRPRSWPRRRAGRSPRRG